jgi:hypothetical protein
MRGAINRLLFQKRRKIPSFVNLKICNALHRVDRVLRVMVPGCISIVFQPPAARKVTSGWPIPGSGGCISGVHAITAGDHKRGQ